jgi:hypothetical protein
MAHRRTRDRATRLVDFGAGRRRGCCCTRRDSQGRDHKTARAGPRPRCGSAPHHHPTAPTGARRDHERLGGHPGGLRLTAARCGPPRLSSHCRTYTRAARRISPEDVSHPNAQLTPAASADGVRIAPLVVAQGNQEPLTDRIERCRIGENQGARCRSISASRLCWCGWALLAWCRHRAGESRRDAPRCLWQSFECRCDTERSGDEQAETQHHDVAGRLCRRL